MSEPCPSTCSTRNSDEQTIRKRDRGLVRQSTALLLIDVINDLAFPGSGVLVAQAEPMALRLAALKLRVAAAGVPVIYVNDNFGQGQVAPSVRLRFHRRGRGRKARRP